METVIDEDLQNFLQVELDVDPTADEIQNLQDLIDKRDMDFHIELDGNEYRVIEEDFIDDIAQDEIQDIVQDCYLGGTDLNKYWWIEIDWKKTAQNCINADGYGHHFASYDGDEFYHEGWYFFRTN